MMEDVKNNTVTRRPKRLVDEANWSFSGRAVIQVWRRNFLVWQKLAIASVLGNIVDPLIALMAFGLGLGSLVGDVQGQTYFHFLAVGAVCLSAMNAPTFESIYSAFSRMQMQKTWLAIMNSPVRLREIVLGECLWASTKGMLSATVMMLVLALFGVGDWAFWSLGLLVLSLACIMFSAFGLCVISRAPGYEFFVFYFTLVITPMTFLSGAFFPREQLPAWLETATAWLPLTLVVEVLRHLFAHEYSGVMALLLIMGVYTVLALVAAVMLTEKRFQS